MRDNLHLLGPMRNESGIINLDTTKGTGTHWVAYKKHGRTANYFDSFGDLPPPKELIRYLYSGPWPANNIFYNYDRKQQFNTVLCGHLSLEFLSTGKKANNT